MTTGNEKKFFRRRKNLVYLPLLLAVFVAFIPFAHGVEGVPKIISYQGRLTDAAGNLLGGSSGTDFYFKFSIWNDPTSTSTANRVWPSGAPGIATSTVTNGVFNVNIGDTANGYPDALTYDFYSNRDIYLQVEVSSNGTTFETLSPRQRIAASGFAINSENVSSKLRVSTSTDFTFDVVNDGAGRANLSVEGQIRVGGFGAAPTAIGGGALYYNTSTGALFLWNDATTTPQWVSLGGGGGGGSTDLQAAYNLGNVITTTDARNILFTLEDTATDSNFVLNIKGATSTGVFQIQASSTPIFTFGRTSSTLATTTISNFTVTGTSSLQGISFTNASGTSLSLTGVADLQGVEFTNASGTSLTLTGVADLQGIEFTNASGTAMSLTSNLVVGGVLTANTITPNAAMTIGATGQTLTLQGSSVTLNSNSNNPIIFNASTTEVARIDGGSGQILIGTSTATTTAKLVLWGGVASETSSVSGIYQESRINTSLSGNFQFGNRHIVYVGPTASTSAVGEFVRMIDNTTLKNVVRAMEVQAWSGTNVQGVNTGLFAAGRTFGVQAVSNGSAGGVAAPAAIFAEIQSATQGQALRLYSSQIASSTQDMAQFFQEVSTFEGTGLKMDFARTGGAFTGNFVDFRRGNLTKFSVNATGSVTIAGSSTLVRASSTLIVCGQDNCTLASSSVQSLAWFSSADGTTSTYSIVARGAVVGPTADFGEYVPVIGSPGDYEAGDLLSISSSTDLFTKSRVPYDANLLGAVTESASFIAGASEGTENKVVMAVAGRIPVKVSGEGGSIAIGDLITASTLPGHGMKATSTGRVVGVALEPFNATTTASTGKILVLINPHYYYAPQTETLQGGTSGDMEMNNFTFDESLTTVIKTGTLVANKVYAMTLTVGSQENPSGITLYDVRTGFPYCVYIDNGEFKHIPGTCDTLEFTPEPGTPAASGNDTNTAGETTTVTTTTDNANSTTSVDETASATTDATATEAAATTTESITTSTEETAVTTTTSTSTTP